MKPTRSPHDDDPRSPVAEDRPVDSSRASHVSFTATPSRAWSPASRAPAEAKAAPIVVTPFPSPMEPVRHVKSTLLMSSVAALRQSGHFDRYYEHLDPKFEDAILQSVAGAWVPVAVARAHYAACDALALTAAEQMAIGGRTGQGIKQHLTRFVGAVSREAGVTPWSLFEQFNRFWARSFDGGGICVTKLGPKDAEVVYARCSLLESPYFRSALRGVAVGLLASITHRSFMSEVAGGKKPDDARYRFSWV